MDLGRLNLLLELSREGSMRAVADVSGLSTSAVSQQIAALSREMGAALVEPDGRGVRLTPAGRRLAEHAVTILAAVDAARSDLDPAADPAGTVRTAGYATAVMRTLVPIAESLRATNPEVRVVIQEMEPAEARDALLADRIDLAVAYDYDLAPVNVDRMIDSTPLWISPWGLAMPTHLAPAKDLASPALFARFASTPWIGNPRNPAEEAALMLVASMGGFRPAVDHNADSLDLVEEMILAGLGIGMLPADREPRDGITIVPLRDPTVSQRTFAWTRPGRTQWPPLMVVMRELLATT